MHRMSLEPRNGREANGDHDGEEPLVPEGVLRGMDDVAEGRTASKEDIEEVLKF